MVALVRATKAVGARTSSIGEMAERFKAPVLKTGEGSNLPWVRIPLSPPYRLVRSTSTAAKPRIVNSEGSPPASRHRIRGRHGSLPRLSIFLPHMRSATPKQAADGPLRTPDGRYLVVRGRLWRATNPDLPAEARDALVHALMDARRAVKAALRTRDAMQLKAARGEVDAAKTGLGERGAVWWNDGAPDFNRHLIKNTPYADWFARQEASQETD